jgi:hypothetical protein
MGHNLPKALWKPIAELIEQATQKTSVAAA